MFDHISPKYDFLNRLLSFGIDQQWRRKALKMLAPYKPEHLLDMATGTGDIAFMAHEVLHPKQITAVDLSEGMLQIARKKAEEKKLTHISFTKGDSENLPFEDNNFDAAIVSFGVRNFENVLQGLSELNRTLKPNKPLVVLEFSKPNKFPIKQLYGFYSKYILPTIGSSISRSKEAYSYLPDSVNAFPEGENFIALMDKAGFKNNSQTRLLGGICTIYKGEKN